MAEKVVQEDTPMLQEEDEVDASTQDDASLLEELESDICDRLRYLDLSQQSIESESNYLLRVALPGSASPTFLVDLIVRFILRSHRTKKLPYIYLANDLVQKSMLNQKKASSNTDQAKEVSEGGETIEKFNDFHEAFAPPKINKVLEQLFSMLKNSESYGVPEQQLQSQVIKVVSVWKQRKVYPEQALVELKTNLAQIQDEALSKKSQRNATTSQQPFVQRLSTSQSTEPQSRLAGTKSTSEGNRSDIQLEDCILTNNQNSSGSNNDYFSNSFGATELRICTIDQVWVEFATQIEAVQEGKRKIKELEVKIEHEMTVNELMADSFERMLVEYQTLLKQQKTFSQQLLRQLCEKLFNRVDNLSVEQTILLDKVDKAIARLMRLEIQSSAQLK